MAEAGRRRSVARTDRRENPSSIGRPDLKPVLLEIDAAQSSPVAGGIGVTERGRPQREEGERLLTTRRGEERGSEERLLASRAA